MKHEHEHRAGEVDPVCGMTIDPEKAAGSSRVGGKVYFFCSISCKQKFNADPAAWVGSRGRESGRRHEEARRRVDELYARWEEASADAD